MVGLSYNYDLEQRTTDCAKRVVRLCMELHKNEVNRPLISQIIRSAGSVGANYREANDALGNKDFIYRMKIARKECKESLYWLEIIEEANPKLASRMNNLKQKMMELKNILSSIIIKKENKD